MVGQTGLYCWCRFQRTVDTAEVVVSNEESDCCFVILPLLTVRVSQPGEAPDLHANGLVGPFRVTGANAVSVWIAATNVGVSVNDLAG